jgi:hypothetical protein
VELARKAIAGRPYLAPAFIHWPMIEVECWYNPLTCEAVFGSTPDEPPYGWWRGRSDYIGRTSANLLKAGDHKTGSPRHQTPPGKSAQLGYFGNWLANHPDSAPEVKSNGLQLEVYTTQDGSVHTVHQSLDALATQAAAMAALEAKLQVVEAGGPEAEKVIAENPPVVNRECHFCPVKPNCPAWQAKYGKKTSVP